MSLGQVIVYLFIAIVCGLIGQRIAGRALGGFVVSLVVGIAGSLLGGDLAARLHAPEPLRVHVGDQSIPILWAIIGATLVTFAVALIRRAAVRHV
jgi:uncharacterized membrane protein YeaQ/YmgE (transglycosylase-associated protein family)